MNQLSDVGILYDLIGASHVPYREIKLNESRSLSLTLWPLLSLIDISNVEIKTVSATERAERSLVHQANPNVGVTEVGVTNVGVTEILDITANSIKPINVDSIGINFKLDEPLDSVSNDSFLNVHPVTEPENVSIKPVIEMSDTLDDLLVEDSFHIFPTDSEVNVTLTVPKETSDSTILSSNISNSEMADLMQRLTQSKHQEKPTYKQSFFERSQIS